jgi:hypothetical protein
MGCSRRVGHAKNIPAMSQDIIGWVQVIILGGFQTVVFVIQTVVFRYQAKMLRQTVAAATDTKRHNDAD